MARAIGRRRVGLAVLLSGAAWVVHAQDARLTLFDRYNHAQTYDDIKPLVSGVLAEQYASIASRDVGRAAEILASQQLAAYRPRIVEIDRATSFLVLENITAKVGGDTSAQAYLLLKGGTGAWTLSNRLMPDTVVKTLWTTRFTPSDFLQSSSCAIDGNDIRPQSVMAIRRGTTIEVTLHPFRFSDADLNYWRQVSGMTVGEAAVAGSHFNDAATPVCRLIVKVDSGSQLSLLNVGFNDRSGSVTRSRLWQPPKGTVSTLALEKGVLAVITSGTFGTDRDGMRWNVNVRVPAWQKGL